LRSLSLKKRDYYGRGIAYCGEKEYDKAWADVHKAEELGQYIDYDFFTELKKASARDE